MWTELGNTVVAYLTLTDAEVKVSTSGLPDSTTTIADSSYHRSAHRSIYYPTRHIHNNLGTFRLLNGKSIQRPIACLLTCHHHGQFQSQHIRTRYIGRRALRCKVSIR